MSRYFESLARNDCETFRCMLLPPSALWRPSMCDASAAPSPPPIPSYHHSRSRRRMLSVSTIYWFKVTVNFSVRFAAESPCAATGSEKRVKRAKQRRRTVSASKNGPHTRERLHVHVQPSSELVYCAEFRTEKWNSTATYLRW